MKLKKLMIRFQNIDKLFSDVDCAIKKKRSLSDATDILQFDSVETYRSFMTSNKMDILTAISRQQPDSIYQLALHLGRKPQHVTADCLSLESHGFIKLVKSDKARRPIRPELIFDYDVICIDSDRVNSIPVSKKSELVLRKALAG